MEPPDHPSAPPPQHSKEYKRIVHFIHSLFPQCIGDQVPPEKPLALFEHFFAVPKESSSPVLKLIWFGRVHKALEDAYSKLLAHVGSKRSDSSLIPPHSDFYSVYQNPSEGKALPLDKSLESQFDKLPTPARLVGVNLRESEILEATFRSQSETLSHSMWVLSALLGYIKLQGFAPADPTLFDQMVTSISKGLAHQAKISAACTSFITHKRRAFLISHLPPFFPELSRKSLLSAPAALADQLFKESDISSLLESASVFSTLRSQQAMIDVASKSVSSSSRSRSPRRSPYRQSGYRRRFSRSPARSPKRVRFKNQPVSTAKSPPPKKNFQ